MSGYLGSKGGSGVYQAIIALMPPHDTYVELFAGSAQVLRRKPPASQSFAVDLSAAALSLIPRDVTVRRLQMDAMSFLYSFDFALHGRTLFYVDPPYLHSTRTSRARYEFEMTDADHKALLQRLMLVPSEVILSGYPSELYESMLSGWRSRELQVMTRGGVRTEKLWYNFEPSAVHYATYYGKDYIERQRIKRKAARWQKAFSKLPPGERMAILCALLESDPAQSSATVHDRKHQLRLSSSPAAIAADDCAAAAQVQVQTLFPAMTNSRKDTSDLKLGVAER